MIGVLGAVFGTTVSPELGGQIIKWLPSIITILLNVIVTTAIITVYLRVIARHDLVTAYFSAAPGGMIPMAIFGGYYGGDERLISVMQSIRMVLTVITIPIVFRIFGGYEPDGSVGTGVAFEDVGVVEIGLITVVSFAAYLIAARARIPVAQLMGPMIAIGILSGTGTTDWHVPDFLIGAAQLIIGARIGTMFGDLKIREIGGQIFHAVFVSIFMISIAALFAWATSFISEIPIRQLILGFAPGGFAEMSIVGFALGADVTFIITHQLARFFLIMALVPFSVRLLKLNSGRQNGENP